MSETKYIKIGESEEKGKELLAAASRLEKKFPELKKINSGISAVRQRFEAICEPVKIEELDRRGSLIGGTPFLSPDYPEPEYNRGGSMKARQSCVCLSPLAQLDLEQISDCTGEAVGSGLLQVWMQPGLWGQEPYLGDLEIRLVPRDVVDSTEVLLGTSTKEDAEWFREKAAELEVLKIVDPKRAEEDEEIYQEHYWSGVDGLDWTLSVFSDYENCDSLGRFGAPQQIVDWQPSGFTIPPTGNYGMWDWNEDDFERKFSELFDNPDYKVICDILSKFPERPKCALFDVYYDFYNSVYGTELYYGDDSADWSWRPLFAFPGPLSDRVGDEHVIFYRESDDGFEYAGASMRWNWH